MVCLVFSPTGRRVIRLVRYAVYYDKVRLGGIEIRQIEAMESFSNGLLNFVYQTPADDFDCAATCAAGEECVYGPDRETSDGVCAPAWGLYDPLPIPGKTVPAPSDDRLFLTEITQDPNHVCHPNSSNPLPSQCNPCCVPESLVDPLTSGNTPIFIRPECCDAAVDSCGTASTCQEQSPYGQVNANLGNDSFYAHVYDSFYENYENNFFSLRELIGRDDDNRFYHKDPDNPNFAQQIPRPGSDGLDVVFSGRDVTGYYRSNPPASPDETENRVSIYDLLHKLYDDDSTVENRWGFDLSTVDPTDSDFFRMPACKWCDTRLAESSACDPNLP